MPPCGLWGPPKWKRGWVGFSWRGGGPGEVWLSSARIVKALGKMPPSHHHLWPTMMRWYCVCLVQGPGGLNCNFLWRILLLLLWRAHQLFIAPMPRGTCWMTSTGLNMISFMTSIWFSICVSHSSPSRNPLSGRRTPFCQLLQKRRWWQFFSG